MELDLDEYTQRRIHYGAFERDELLFARRFLRPGDVFFDVGAHVGLFALVAAAAVGPTGSIIAFEPVPANVDRLDRNVRLNEFRNITVIRAAVGRSGGRITIGDASPASGSTGQFTIGGGVGATEVPIVTLDDYSSGVGLARIRLAKIDVEGYERHVLEGADRLLSEHAVDAIVFEVNKRMLERQGASARSIAGLLRSYDYRLEGIPRGDRRRHLPEKLMADPPPERNRRGQGTLRAGIAERGLLFNVLAVSPTCR